LLLLPFCAEVTGKSKEKWGCHGRRTEASDRDSPEKAGVGGSIPSLATILCNHLQSSPCPYASELLKAIKDALKGISYVTPRDRRAMNESYIRDPKGAARRRELTDRQREVLQLLAEGRSMKEIADILNVSQPTVCFHKYRVMETRGSDSST